jgi:two-component system, response regulator PdtaR
MPSALEGPNVDLLKGVPVLVVEDAWHVAKALKSTLKQMGIHVVGPTATTAHARSLAAEQRPELAIVDVNLKLENSLGLIDELHEQGVRIIVISGYAAPPVSKDSVAAILQKPFSASELITTVHRIIASSAVATRRS